jgi:hypothetical protein
MQLQNPYNKHLLSLNGLPNPYNRNLLNLGGLGFMEYLAAAGSLLGSGDGGSPVGTGMTPPTNTVTVNPNINVNPQISPVFQQQFQPNNSPIAAGTSQGAPSGSGSGGGLPSGVSTPMIPNVPAIPIDWNKYLLYGGIGIAALVAVKLLSNKRRAPVRRRRVSKAK